MTLCVKGMYSYQLVLFKDYGVDIWIGAHFEDYMRRKPCFLSIKHEEWIQLQTSILPIQSWGVWDVYLYLPPDVYFYCNRVTKRAQWSKPCSLEEHDLMQFNKKWEIIKRGYTLREEKAALALQNAYRIKRSKVMRQSILKGICIMKKSETEYLKHPFKFGDKNSNKNIVYLCNYMLFFM